MHGIISPNHCISHQVCPFLRTPRVSTFSKSAAETSPTLLHSVSTKLVNEPGLAISFTEGSTNQDAPACLFYHIGYLFQTPPLTTNQSALTMSVKHSVCASSIAGSLKAIHPRCVISPHSRQTSGSCPSCRSRCSSPGSST